MALDDAARAPLRVIHRDPSPIATARLGAARRWRRHHRDERSWPGRHEIRAEALTRWQVAAASRSSPHLVVVEAPISDGKPRGDIRASLVCRDIIENRGTGKIF